MADTNTEVPPTPTPSPAVSEGSTPVPVSEHKYKKKRPIYDSDLLKPDLMTQIQYSPLSPMEQVIGILIGIGLAWGSHQLFKMVVGMFTKKAACCAIEAPPMEVPSVPTP
jgi:hypothetical protein